MLVGGDLILWIPVDHCGGEFNRVQEVSLEIYENTPDSSKSPRDFFGMVKSPFKEVANVWLHLHCIIVLTS